MRSRAALLAVIMLLSGCGGDPMPPAPRDWQPPTQPASTALPSAQTASAAPPATPDPGCATGQMGSVLVWVEDQFKRGAFDRDGTAELDRVEVLAYHLALGEVEDKAGFEVYRATTKARSSLNAYIGAPKGSAAARLLAGTVRSAMADLARSCHMDAALSFAD